MSKWRKVRVGDVCDLIKGETGIAKATPGKYPLVSTGAGRKTCNTYQLNAKAVCIFPWFHPPGTGKRPLITSITRKASLLLEQFLRPLSPKMTIY
ncbi:MAG: restriction endonuclease subunit S [Desulfobulbaceae bacterium]|nr:restriction endonuclease subunit S [Desulfobulbaceae bacterium]